MSIHYYILFLIVNLIINFIISRFFVEFFEASILFQRIVILLVMINFISVGIVLLKGVDWRIRKSKILIESMCYVFLALPFLIIMYGSFVLNAANIYNFLLGVDGQVVISAKKVFNPRPSKGHPEYTILFGESRNLRGEGKEITREEFNSLPNEFSVMKINKKTIVGTTVIQYVYPM